MPTADLFTVRKAAPPAVLSLRASLHKLPQGDQDFARSLLSRADAGAMSAKVEHWIGVLSERASAPPAAKTDGLGKIVDILAGAARTLKFPVIRFEADGVQYRLGRSGPTSREPGSVNVTSEGNFADRSYFGRIGLDGIFQPSHKFGETATAIGAALRAFAADPVEQARIYGQRFGRCCFCGRELTDGASVHAGYGPICADKFSLPWGDRE